MHRRACRAKPLCDIAGKPMVQRVYEQAAKASKLTAVVVAVDNPKVYDTVVTFGGHAVMTREDHANGTDRLAEAVGHFSPMLTSSSTSRATNRSSHRTSSTTCAGPLKQNRT